MPRASRTGIRGLFKDGRGRWRIDLRWREPGSGVWRRVTERLPTGITAAAAKEHARKLMSAALAGGYERHRDPGRRLAAAFKEYVGWRRTNGRVAVEKQEASTVRLVASIGDVALDQVSPFAVEKFKRDRAAGGAGPATVNRDLAVLRHFYGLAARWGWVSKAQAASIREVRSLKEPPGRVRYLSDDEEEKLLAKLKPHVRRLVAFTVLTGLRMGEVRQLRKSAVDLGARVITLVKTKSNRVRHVPLNDAAVEILREAMHGRGEYVFTSRKGTPYSERGLRSTFASACARAKVEGVRVHDLRHTFATRIRRAGAGIDVIAKLLGHSSLAMATRYTHLEERTLRAAVDALPAPRISTARVTGGDAPGSSTPAEAMPTPHPAQTGTANG